MVIDRFDRKLQGRHRVEDQHAWLRSVVGRIPDEIALKIDDLQSHLFCRLDATRELSLSLNSLPRILPVSARGKPLLELADTVRAVAANIFERPLRLCLIDAPISGIQVE